MVVLMMMLFQRNNDGVAIGNMFRLISHQLKNYLFKQPRKNGRKKCVFNISFLLFLSCSDLLFICETFSLFSCIAFEFEEGEDRKKYKQLPLDEAPKSLIILFTLKDPMLVK
jgi:hypothetical protein